ncbi:pseudoazurin [Paracoccus aminovorans]|uniref:Pseudoazurin n=1 Tax=Paracoccus aminovorans TaxID=34004 RepID=A0A1I3CXB1_9RHOB|nr:pseudoazurin [Paracoccus aminovorans]CQR83931.1 pseudoazurin [Paracoccus aminovorans]SFH78871.1 pseudoazurin [Paracoccus aminovorans]
MKRSLTMAAVMTALAFPAFAADHQVQMLNKGEAGAMVFEPAFVQAEVGDTVTFVPTAKGHDVVSLPDMLPEGVAEFESKLNEEYVLTVETPGLYGVKCKPHFPMGMVALIQVGGDASNYDALAEGKLPKKARERMDAALAQVTR